MKKPHIPNIYKESLDVYHVTSEPGDGTRYDYYIWKNYDRITFIPNESRFKFPQPISKWSITSEWSWEDIILQAKTDNCNPHTLKECYNSARYLIKKLNLK